MTTKEEIIAAANRKALHPDFPGDYVVPDDEWIMARTPEQFKAFLEKTYGFEVVECKATSYSPAIATTACGLSIARNGFCSTILTTYTV